MINDAVEKFKRDLDEMLERFKEGSVDGAPSQSSGDLSLKKPEINFLEWGRWLNIIKHPSVVLVVGRRGSGKSALGYKILEYLRWNGQIYIVGLPQKAKKLLPEWVGVIPSLEDIPPKAIVLIDESYNLFHSRASASERALILSNLINLSRQREQTLVFVTQEARQIDKNIASSVDTIIFKNPGVFQPEFERKELKRIAEEAKRMFTAINTKDRNRWAYVYAPGSDFVGMLENSLPGFWSPVLSKAYADSTPVNGMVIPKKMTREEKIKLAKELHRQGFSLGQIVKVLGVSKSTIKNYIDNYPYRNKRGFSF
jgi:hypothetical protein